MLCNNCGKEVPDNATFCPSCGRSMGPTDLTPNPAEYPYQPYQQPNGSYNPNQQPAEAPGKGFAIASLVLGIVSFFCFAYIAGTLAIVFGGVAKNKGYRGNMATAGIVCGIIGIALMVIMTVLGLSVNLL